MSSLKDQILGCGCLVFILLILCITSFFVGGYYGRDFAEAVKEKTSHLYNSIVDKAQDVGDEVKNAGGELLEKASKKGKETVTDDIKESVNNYIDEKINE